MEETGFEPRQLWSWSLNQSLESLASLRVPTPRALSPKNPHDMTPEKPRSSGYPCCITNSRASNKNHFIMLRGSVGQELAWSGMGMDGSLSGEDTNGLGRASSGGFSALSTWAGMT